MPGGTCQPIQSADAEQGAQRAQLLTRLLAEMLEHLPKCQHVTPFPQASVCTMRKQRTVLSLSSLRGS